MASVRLRILGGFDIYDSSNQSINLTVKKAKALFVYLAVQPHISFSRNDLAMFLWPNAANKRARQSLRQAIGDLRKHLSDFDDLIHVTHNALQANKDNLQVDLLCFEQLAKLQDPHSLHEAYRFNRGEFLAGFKVRSEPFVAWCEEVAQRTRERTINIIESLAEHRLLEGDCESAIELSQQLVQLDSVRESAYRNLMSLFAKQGKTDAALELYATCCAELKEHLRADPEIQTIQLYTRIKKQLAVSTLQNKDTPSEQDASLAVASQVPISIGRESEMNTLCSYLQQTHATGQGQCIILSGEDGIGKTHFVSQLCDFATRLDLRIAKTRFFDINTSHENGIRNLVFDLIKTSLPAEIKKEDMPVFIAQQYFNEHAKYDIYLASLYFILGLQIPKRLMAKYSALKHQARENLSQSIILDIISTISSTPLLLILDDCQHLTAYMRRMLIAFMGLTQKAAVVLICIANKDPLIPESSAISTTKFIKLTPLNEVDARLCFNADKSTSHELLYLSWLPRLAHLDLDEQPTTLGELLNLAQQDLAEEDRQALMIATILGLRFSLEALTTLLDNPHYRADALIQYGFLQPCGNTLEFTHVLIQQALYAVLDENKKGTLHCNAASYFLFGNTHLHACHLELAGSHDSSKAYISAALSAREDYKLDMASYFFDKAVSCTQEQAEKYFAVMQKGDMLLEYGRIALAVQAYDQAQQFTHDKQEQTLAWLGMASGLIERKQYAAARSLLERCEPILLKNADHKILAKLYFHLAQTMSMLDVIEVSIRYNKIAFEHAKQAQSGYWQTRVALAVGESEFKQLHLVKAYSTFDFAVRLARENNNTELEVQILIQLAKVKLFQADFQGSASDLEQVMSIASVIEDHESMLEILCILCLLDFYKGKFSRLVQHTGLACELCNMSSPIGISSKTNHITSYQLLAAYHTGNDELLQERLNEIKHSIDPQNINSSYILAPIMALIEQDADDALAYLLNAKDSLENLTGPEALEFCFLSIEAAIHHQLWEIGEDIADKLIMLLRNDPLPFFIMCAERVRILSQIAQNQMTDVTRTELVNIFAAAKHFGLSVHLPAYENALNQLRDPIQV